VPLGVKWLAEELDDTASAIAVSQKTNRSALMKLDEEEPDEEAGAETCVLMPQSRDTER
jgi:hypothetical protein